MAARSRLRTDRALQAVLLVTAVALLARFYLVGARIMHWDEGRVGYDILRYTKTGIWEYRPIVHGPFLVHVNKYVFTIFGVSDASARFVVALVGGLLPLVGLLFRTRLRDSEVVALGVLLALNPILLYYSRFMRNDVLVAAFALFALGFFVRAYDTKNPRHLYAASVALALSFTTKENAILYVVCWLGGMLLLLDHRLFRASERAARTDPDATGAGPGTSRSVATDGGGADAGHDGDETADEGRDVDETVGEDPTADDESTPDETTATEAGETTTKAADATDERDEVSGAHTETDVAAETDEGGRGDHETSTTAPSDDPSSSADGSVATESRLDAIRQRPRDWTDELKDYGRRVFSGAYAWRGPLAVSVVLFLAVLVFFYAPRHSDPAKLGLWNAVANPSTFPAVLEEALVGSTQKFMSTWAAGHHQSHPYLPYLNDFRDTLFAAAGPLVAFAVVGFVADRYAEGGPRDLVALGGYWGFVSVFGYPIATDISAGWVTVHAVVPLAIPAAVGVALVYRWGLDAYRASDAVSVGLSALLLLLALSVTVQAAGGYVYQNPQADDNPLVQYGQPAGQMQGTLADVGAVARANQAGPDVLFYGSHFYVENESEAYRPPIDNNGQTEHNGNWYHRLPLPFYLESYDATVESVQTEDDLASALERDPPVIIVRRCSSHWSVADRQCVGTNYKQMLTEKTNGEYVATEYKLTSSDTWTVFFVEKDALAAAT